MDADGCRPRGVRYGSCGESASEGVRFGVSFACIVVCDWVFSACDEGEGLIVGVGGPEGKGVAVSAALEVAPLFASDAPYRRVLGTRNEAISRTVR